MNVRLLVRFYRELEKFVSEHPILVALVSLILGSSFFLSKIKNDLLAWVEGRISLWWEVFIGNVEIRFYWLLVIFFSPVIAFSIFHFFRKQWTVETPAWQNHLEEVFDNILYKWTIIQKGPQTFSVEDVTKFCSNKDHEAILVQVDPLEEVLVCPVCGGAAHPLDPAGLMSLILASYKSKFNVSVRAVSRNHFKVSRPG